MEHVQSDRAFLKHCSIEGMVVETQSESKVVFFCEHNSIHLLLAADPGFL